MDWLCLGDFNEILDNSEKEGGLPKSNAQLAPFHEVIEECLLGDLGYKGSQFTWCNNREGNEFIKERLDRALANMGWCSQFPNMSAEVLATRTSDHKPLRVQFLQGKGLPSKCFKYEACWEEDEESARVIKNEWEKDIVDENPLSVIAQKMVKCAASLSSWSRSKYGDASKRLTSLTKKLEALQVDQRVTDKAKRNWFKGGDRNTKFFHAWASQRRRNNTIHSVIDEQVCQGAPLRT